MEIRGVNPRPGIIFVVVNMTIENRGGIDYTFNETTVSITDGGLVPEQLYTRLTDRSYWGSIPPNEKRTGNIIFGVKNSTQDFALLFFYHKRQDHFTQELGIIPMGADSSSPETTLDTVDSKQVSVNAKPINVTIHSAFKTMKIHEAFPHSVNNFVVINMTIENLANKYAYEFNEKTVLLNGVGPMTQQLYTQLTNPLYFGPIPPNDKRTGEVVFSVKENTQPFTLKFLNNSGNVILTQEIGNLVVQYYSPLLFPSSLLDSNNFSYVVENLDSPAKAAQYIEAKYTYILHIDYCRSRSPEEFFQLMKGDCKDVATFLSYVLAQHGFDAKVVALKYFRDGVLQGHVVTLFTDTDGRMKYATTPDATIFREVTSVDDLLTKECSRLGVPAIANYAVYPAGSRNACP